MPAGCVLAMCAWPRPKVARRARPRPVGWALEVAQMATFILVHGSWRRAWRFPRGRITLAAMTRTVTRILDSLDEPAILVAHSRGGIVASQAAERRPTRIRALVYLAAYLLRDGERVVDWFRADHDSLIP